MKLNSNSIFILLGIVLLSYGIFKYIKKPVIVDNSATKKTNNTDVPKETAPKEAGMGMNLPLGTGFILIMFGVFFLFLGTSKRISL